jgi:hypothetical protein
MAVKFSLGSEKIAVYSVKLLLLLEDKKLFYEKTDTPRLLTGRS